MLKANFLVIELELHEKNLNLHYLQPNSHPHPGRKIIVNIVGSLSAVYFDIFILTTRHMRCISDFDDFITSFSKILIYQYYTYSQEGFHEISPNYLMPFIC